MIINKEELQENNDKFVDVFLILFDGYERGFFNFEFTSNVSSSGKVETKNYFSDQELKYKHIVGHLKGIKGVAAIPLRSNSSIKFACIDVDDYNIDLNLLDEQIINNELPLILCRSKSGGAHLFIFFENEQKDVKKVVQLLEHYAKDILGLKKYEIFPKQTRRTTEDEAGNGINLPYFGYYKNVVQKECKEYCINNGRNVSFEEFVKLCEAVCVRDNEIDFTKETAIAENNNKMLVINPEYYDAPPCIIQLMVNKIQSGERSNALFSIGVYLNKKFPDDWEERLSSLNQILCVNPLDEDALDNTIIKTLRKKDYFYKCNDLPLKLFCNKSACKKCKYGISCVKDNASIISNLSCIKSTPSVLAGSSNSICWFITINDKFQIKLTTEQLNNVTKLKHCIQEQAGINISLKKEEWEARLNELFIDLKSIEVGDSYSAKERFLSIFKDYLLRKRSTIAESILKGKVFEYEEKGEKKLGFKFDKFYEYYRERVNASDVFDTITIYAIFSSIGVRESSISFGDTNSEIFVNILSIDRIFIERDILLRDSMKKFDEIDNDKRKKFLLSEK